MDHLPLRLEAEPIVRETLGPASRVIGSDGRPALIFVENGLVAIALERLCSKAEAAQAAGLPVGDVPSLLLVRNSLGHMRGLIWMWEGQPLPMVNKDVIREKAKEATRMSEAIAEQAVRNIQRYYAVQVLEPSVRGFLAILEKQFARSDLYLFEVLQNAVDDGASHVRFEPKPQGLAVRHDGRRFNALDVLGLSSVGLSSKGDGQKRTIGFMGIGFKAVYKRFARVVVHDGLWRFAFDEPQGQRPGMPNIGTSSFGWVLQPQWETPQKLWDQVGSPTFDWCHFQLERPREGPAGVTKDLAKLPDSVPPLLGRQALRGFASRGVEALLKKIGAAAKVMTQPELQALPYWWLEAQREFGVVTSDLMDGPYALLLAAFRKAGAGATKESVWEQSKNAISEKLEGLIETPKFRDEFGWRYIDDHGKVQGPFSSKQLRQWYGAGKLRKDLKICGRNMADYHPLQYVFGSKPAFHSPGLPRSCFKLDWGPLQQAVSIVRQTPLFGGGAEEITVEVGAGLSTKTSRWLFLTVVHKPDKEATAAYEKHTRREHVGEEDVSLFYPLDDDGNPAPVPTAPDKSGRGAVHAVLPTELRTPVGAHLQASWLLSVDRQRLQDFADNAWNRALLFTLSKLLTLLLRWVAKEKITNLANAYAILPPMESDASGSLRTDVLGQNMSWDAMKATLKTEALTPILKGDQVVFAKCSDALWLPPSFTQHLSADLLFEWFNIAPLAAPQMQDSIWHSLWHSARQVDASLLKLRGAFLRNAIKKRETPTALAIQLLAALGGWVTAQENLPQVEQASAKPQQAAAKAQPEQAAPKSAAAKAAAAKAAALNAIKSAANAGAKPGSITPKGPISPAGAGQTKPTANSFDVAKLKAEWMEWLPEFGDWPVFWTDKQEVVTPQQIRWPDETWGQLPQDVREILEENFGSAVGAGIGQHALHPSLLPLMQPPAGDSIKSLLELPGVNAGQLAAARKCLHHARKEFPASTVSIGDAVKKCFVQFQKESLAPTGLKPATVEKVVKITRWARDGLQYDIITHALFNDKNVVRLLPVSSLQLRSDEVVSIEKVSGVSLNYISDKYLNPDGDNALRWETFWQKCGASSGLAFAASVTELHAADKFRLPDKKPPQLRNSPKTVELPYTLGQLSNKQHRVVDVQMASEWEGVLTGMNAAVPDGDHDEWLKHASAFARLIAQLTPDVTGGTPTPDPPEKPSTINIPKPTSTKPLLKGNAPPGCRRLFYLPPAQPDASKLQLGAAAWVRTLCSSKWVPGREGESKVGLYKPSEVLLKADPAKPGLPIASLPVDVRKSFEGKIFMSLFNWGTVAPEAPVDQLADIASGKSNDAPEPIWRAIVNAHRLGGLKPDQRSKLKLMSSKPILPVGPDALLDGMTKVGVNRCGMLSDDAKQEDKEELTALVDSRWLVDVRSSSWPLHDLLEDISKIIEIPTKVSSESMVSFLSFCGGNESQGIGNLRDAFSIALARASADAIKKFPHLKPPDAVKKLIPSLKLFCREGPGLGNDRFPERWLPAFDHGPKDVRPILNDDGAKAAMLTPAQGFQFLGVLDHPASRFPSGQRLHDKDCATLKTLAIQRLSDPRLKMRTRIEGEPQVSPASARMGMVLRLLWRNAGLKDSKEDDGDESQLQLCTCESITRELATPDGATAEMESFAVWGEPDESGREIILIAGDPDDYAAELEELLEQKFNNLFTAHSGRPTKVLRLLRHLENEKTFLKYVERDFPGFLKREEVDKRRMAEDKRLAEVRRKEEERARKQAEEEAGREEAKRQAEEKALQEREERVRRAEAAQAAAEARARQAEETARKLKLAQAELVAEEEADNKRREEEIGRLEEDRRERDARKQELLQRVVDSSPKVEDDQAESEDDGDAQRHEVSAKIQNDTEAAKEVMADGEADAVVKLPGLAKVDDGKVSVTFKPGPLGLTRNGGQITSIKEGGQAQKLGLEVGWKIVTVQGKKCESFEDRVFQAAQNSNRSFAATFVKAQLPVPVQKEEEADEKAEKADEAKADDEPPQEEPSEDEEEARLKQLQRENEELKLRKQNEEKIEEKGEEKANDGAPQEQEESSEDEEEARLKQLRKENEELKLRKQSEENGESSEPQDSKRRKLDVPEDEASSTAKRPLDADEAVEAKRPKRSDEEQRDDDVKVDATAEKSETQQEEEQLEKLRRENRELKQLQEPEVGESNLSKLEEELERLRKENDLLKVNQERYSSFPIGFGIADEGGEERRDPLVPVPDEEEQESEPDDTPVTKGQIKKMKEEAKAVLETPIGAGFGFKMLEKMGWKPGQGLGKDNDGIADPLWVNPREGKCGLFAAEGESRPKKPDADAPLEERLAEAKPFVPEGYEAPAEVEETAKYQSPQEEAAPRPDAATLAPAVLNFLLRQEGKEHVRLVGEVFVEALAGEAGERFVQLIDERLGPRVAPRIAALRRRGLSYRVGTPQLAAADAALQPLWNLTRHHVPHETD